MKVTILGTAMGHWNLVPHTVLKCEHSQPLTSLQTHITHFLYKQVSFLVNVWCYLSEWYNTHSPIHFILKFSSLTYLYKLLKCVTNIPVFYSSGFQTSYIYGTPTNYIWKNSFRAEFSENFENYIFFSRGVIFFPNFSFVCHIVILSPCISGHKTLLKKLNVCMCKELRTLLALICLDASNCVETNTYVL